MRAILKFTLTALATASLTLGASMVSAATYTTNASADAFVTTGPTGNLSADNFGGAGALSVAASGLGNGEFQSVIKFSAAGAASSFNSQFGVGQWTIQSVTLQLTATPNNNPGTFNTTAAGQFNVSLMLDNSWTEGTGTPANPTTDGITFNTLQSTFDSGGDQAAGTFGFNGATSGLVNYSLTLGSGLMSDIEEGGVVGLHLSAADSVVSYLFNSRSGGSSSSHPELVITAIPEPASVGLGALGLATVLSWRCGRRFRAASRGC